MNGDWNKVKDCLPEIAFRTNVLGQKEKTCQYNWTVVWDKYGEYMLIPTGRDPVYYIRKGYLIDKPENPEPLPIVKPEKIENVQTKMTDEISLLRAEIAAIRAERLEELKEENKRLKKTVKE